MKQKNDSTIDLLAAFQSIQQDKRPEPSKKSDFEMVMVAENILVQDGNLRVALESSNILLDFHHLTIQAQADLKQKTGTLHFRAPETLLNTEGRQLTIQPLSLSITLPADNTASIQLAAQTDGAAIDLHGTIDQVLQDPHLGLQLDVDASLTKIDHFLNLQAGLSGKTRGRLTLTGNWRDPVADLQLYYEGGKLFGYALDGLVADLHMANQQVAIKQLDIMAGSGELRLNGGLNLDNVFPKGFASKEIHLDATAYDLLIQLTGIDFNRLPPAYHRFEGMIDADVHIKGKGIHFSQMSATADIHSQVAQFHADALQQSVDLEIDVAGGIQAGVIEIKDMVVNGVGAHLSAHGSVEPSSGSIQGNLGIEAENVREIMDVIGGPAIGGSAAISNVSGPWQQPWIDLILNADHVQLNGIHYGHIELAARLDDRGLLKIESLTLANQETRVSGNAAIHLFTNGFNLNPLIPINGHLRVSGVELDHFFDGHPVKGVFQGTLKIDGTIQSLQASAALQGSDVTYRDVTLGDLHADLHWQDGRMTLDPLRIYQETADGLVTGTMQIFAGNTWQLLAEPVMDLDVRITGLALENYLESVTGQLELDAHVTGPPSHLAGTGLMSGRHLEVMNQPVPSLDPNFEIKDQRVELQWRQARIDRSDTLTGSGWIGFDRTYSIDLRANDFQIEKIEKGPFHGCYPGENGPTRLRRRQFERPAVHADLQLKDVIVNSQPMQDVTFDMKLEHDRLYIEGHQSFDLRANYDLSQREYDLEMHFVETDLTPFFYGCRSTGYRRNDQWEAHCSRKHSYADPKQCLSGLDGAIPGISRRNFSPNRKAHGSPNKTRIVYHRITGARA